MARRPRESRLETREARAKLKPRGEPYWTRVGVLGAFLGYRRGKRGGVWVARRYTGAGYEAQGVGQADDVNDADGRVVLNYDQAAERVRTFAKGQVVDAPKHHADGVTLNDAFDYYIKHPKANTTAASKLLATRTWNRHIRDALGWRLVASVKATDYGDWRNALALKPPTNRGKVMPFDPEDPNQLRARKVSANRAINVLKAALNWAWKNDQIPGPVGEWKKLDKFKSEDVVPRMLAMDEVRRLLNAAAPDFRKILTGALLTGCRYGELCALQVKSYDADNRKVAVSQTKTGKNPFQPLTTEGVEFFEGLTAGRPADDPLFQRADGRAWGPGDQHRPMRDAANAAKVADVSFKAMRASYGKALLDATRDIEMVAKALGHSDSRITRKHYARYLEADLAQAIAKMPALGLASDRKVRRIKARPKAGGTG